MQDIERVSGEATVQLVVSSLVSVPLVIARSVGHQGCVFPVSQTTGVCCQEPTGAVCAGRVIMRRVRGNVQAKKCANLHWRAATVTLENAQEWRGTHHRCDPLCFGTHQPGGAYLGARPARKKVLGVCHKLNELVSRLPTFIPPEAMVYQVNQVLRGWANYFCYGTYTPAFQIVHLHACRRVRRWLRRKFELDGQGYGQHPDSYLERELGLLNIRKLPRRYSWAKP